MKPPVSPIQVHRYEATGKSTADDLVVTEEPLEMRLGYGDLEDRKEIRLSVTMRTPGHDEELALGFLYTESIITSPAEVLRVEQCHSVKEEELGNVVRAELDPSIEIDPHRWQRNFYTTSSCGVCGKSSLEAVQVQCEHIEPFGEIEPALITSLPEKMRSAQTVFKHTGGIHAAALFNREGELLILREDIGRHNAVDKVIGAMLNSGIDPFQKTMLVSGRAGFELVQKCAVAGIPVMAAVGAPSSLSVELARTTGITLIGFLRGDRFNSYT